LAGGCGDCGGWAGGSFLSRQPSGAGSNHPGSPLRTRTDPFGRQHPKRRFPLLGLSIRNLPEPPADRRVSHRLPHSSARRRNPTSPHPPRRLSHPLSAYGWVRAHTLILRMGPPQVRLPQYPPLRSLRWTLRTPSGRKTPPLSLWRSDSASNLSTARGGSAFGFFGAQSLAVCSRTRRSHPDRSRGGSVGRRRCQRKNPRTGLLTDENGTYRLGPPPSVPMP
jgi:hypothetical protein